MIDLKVIVSFAVAVVTEVDIIIVQTLINPIKIALSIPIIALASSSLIKLDIMLISLRIERFGF